MKIRTFSYHQGNAGNYISLCSNVETQHDTHQKSMAVQEIT